MPSERRDNLRVPDSRLITEFVRERPSPASIVNISNNGVYTLKKSTPQIPTTGLIQLDIPLPEASESIWAVGEIVFEQCNLGATASGIKFVSMADCHKRLIQDLVEFRRRNFYSIMMAKIKEHKNLAAVSITPGQTVFAKSKSPPTENTIRMYMLPR